VPQQAPVCGRCFGAVTPAADAAVMVQGLLPAVTAGENKRILLVNGDRWARSTRRPLPGEFPQQTWAVGGEPRSHHAHHR